MKYRLNGEWVELKVKSKDQVPINAIIDYDGITPPPGYIEVEDEEQKEQYSTTETKTNKLWIDGKPIYRKVFTGTTPSTINTWVDVFSMSNVDTLVNMYGFLIGSDGRKCPINDGEPSYEIVTTVLNNSIQMNLKHNSWANKNVYIIAEYTKTTD